jgi:hypothetical protein
MFGRRRSAKAATVHQQGYLGSSLIHSPYRKMAITPTFEFRVILLDVSAECIHTERMLSSHTCKTA